jgi:SAM-dependent methyltransferase
MQYSIPDTAPQSAKRYWNSFYGAWKTRIPSQFSSFVAVEIEFPSLIIDIGCGNGRDSFFFADLGHKVVGLDRSATAIAENLRKIGKDRLADCTFCQVDVENSHELTTCLRGIVRDNDGRLPIIVYARFFLHSITDMAEAILFKGLGSEMPSGTDIYLEFRNEQDEEAPKLFAGHYRRFVNRRDVATRMTSDANVAISYAIDGQGMAKYRSEDPHISRIIARRL